MSAGVATLPADLLHTETYLRDPYPAWHRLRHDAPAWWDPVARRWIITRYDDVLAVFREWRTFGVRGPYRRFSDQIGTTLVDLDGDAHATRRAIVAPELVGRRLDRQLPCIAARVAALFETWPLTGRAQPLGQVADRLPLLVIAELLGLDDADHPFFAACSERILAGLGGDAGTAALGREAHGALAAHFDPRIDARAGDREADLISGIVAADMEGTRLTRDEVHSMISLLLVAGGETTALALANLWADLVAEPGIAEALRADPSRMDAAISEAMRRDGPVIAEDREVMETVELHGVSIPAGSTVRAYIGSANADETVFAEPRAFRLDRTDLHQGKESRPGGRDPDGRWGHLTFGAGAHFCLGYQLARAEMAAATTTLLERSPRLAFAADPPGFSVEMALMRRVDRYAFVVG